MSHKGEHFDVSGTKIAYFGYTKQNVVIYALHGLVCSPVPLWQRTSRVYQDPAPTSFVPPAHNQGVSLAPLQGPALWKIFLPTTGSFFVITDSFLYSSTGWWTFSCRFGTLFCLLVTVALFSITAALSRLSVTCSGQP